MVDEVAEELYVTPHPDTNVSTGMSAKGFLLLVAPPGCRRRRRRGDVWVINAPMWPNRDEAEGGGGQGRGDIGGGVD